MTEHILETLDRGVLTLTLNRPERKNALTPAMYERLAYKLSTADADADVRVVVVTGAGDAFTSGNDLADFAGTPPAGPDSPVFRFLRALVALEKPLVAVVNGTAVGVGVTMLLHCDLAFAAEGARFQLPFVNLGLVPEAASSLLLPALAGHLRASELLLLGERFDAAEAARIGLVNRVHPAAELVSKAGEKIRALADQPGEAVRLTKQLLKGGRRAEVDAVLAREGELFVQRLASPAAAEAFSAFFEKRRPDFRSVGE